MKTPASLTALVGVEKVSSWVEVTQDAITQFAEITGDRQWIHVDAERARRDSPYGGTIAHGFLTLSLISRLMRDAVGAVDGARLSINYGLNKVRFPAALPAGSRVRGRCVLQRLDEVDGGLQATWNVLVERDGGAKPCCAAEWLVRYYL
ncbi:MAG: dehydratase [Acidobacteria bacterium RIFCSPLOWO2_12_FULL_67_14b]|nr:MAG: dehydratase [Acidobacteria bacterium RIFCSPLOWO2_12_FULL_67_14b]